MKQIFKTTIAHFVGITDLQQATCQQLNLKTILSDNDDDNDDDNDGDVLTCDPIVLAIDEYSIKS